MDFKRRWVNEARNAKAKKMILVASRATLCILMSSLIVICQAGQSTKCTLSETISRSPNIVVANVIQLGDSPGYSSGYVLATQRVKFEITLSIRGTISEKTIVVPFLISKGKQSTSFEDLSLNPSFFKMGNSLILFLGRDRSDIYFDNKKEKFKSYEYQSEDCFFLASDENVDLVREILTSR